MEYDTFIANWLGKAIDWVLRITTESTTSWKMKFSVATTSMKFKILNPIVQLISIYMVNNLVSIKFTSQTLLNNLSMLQNIAWSNFNVAFVHNTSTSPSRVIDASHKRPLARIRAEYSSSTLIINKLFTTLYTLKMSFSRLIITSTIAKPSFLRGWSFKFGSTEFTNMFHNLIIQHTLYGGQYYGL